MSIASLTHPSYLAETAERALWRITHEGGRRFVQDYLVQFSKREDFLEFNERKKMTYCPSHASTAVREVANSIYDRMPDVTREGGSPSYQFALTGIDGGVDLQGGSQNYFMGEKVLPELLAVRKVGVFVDMPKIDGMTLLDVAIAKARPYYYLYQAEEIYNWTYDYSQSNRIFTRLLLRETVPIVDQQYGMVKGNAVRFRYLWLEGGKCWCRFYDSDSQPIDMFFQRSAQIYDLGISKIPFVMFEVPCSLYKDTAQMQVALMNMESSDINYILKANFPFYVEQIDPRPFAPNNQDGVSKTEDGKRELEVGVQTGRGYTTQQPPQFIHPSAEPLKASIEKQTEMKKDIRLLTHLTLSVMFPMKTASSDSKRVDYQGLEAGLASIGLELERGERLLAEYWGLYEKQTPAEIIYPTSYSIKSDKERQDEADFFEKKIPSIPSLTYQRNMAKMLAKAMLSHKVSEPELQKIYKEIDKAPFLVVDPVVNQNDVDRGILDRGNAAKARLYPDDAVTKANVEQAERLAAIAKSQGTNSGAVPDTQVDPKGQAKDQKTTSQDGSNDPNPGSKTRGNAL